MNLRPEKPAPTSSSRPRVDGIVLRISAVPTRSRVLGVAIQIGDSFEHHGDWDTPDTFGTTVYIDRAHLQTIADVLDQFKVSA